MELLILLASREGQLVTRSEIADRLWASEVFVDTEHGINTAIRKLRSLFRDDPDNPQFIQTVIGMGYRFIAPITTFQVPSSEAVRPGAASVDPVQPKEAITPEAFTGAATPPTPNYPAWVGLTGLAALLAPAAERIESSGSEIAEVVSGESSPGTPDRGPRTKTSSRRWIWMSTTALTLIAVATVWAVRHRSLTPKIRSMTVLPLHDLSSVPNTEYLADGMTEELVSDLSAIPELQVVSDSSTAPVKDSPESLTETARKLGVDAVIQGSVLRSRDKISLDIRLFDARSDRQLWAGRFEDKPGNASALQKHIAAEIAAQARVLLTPSQQARLNDTKPLDPSAYDGYLQGRYLLNKRDADGAVKMFRRAVVLDPGYARSWAGLAAGLADSGGEPGQEDPIAEAKAAARHAIELDPENGEAWSALGQIAFNQEWDWKTAEYDLQRATELSPSDPTIHVRYAIFLSIVGRRDEAVSHMRRALELDPLSFFNVRFMGSVLHWSRRYDESLEYIRKAEAMEPDLLDYTIPWEVDNYTMKGMDEQAAMADLRNFSFINLKRWQARLEAAYRSGGRKAYWATRIEFDKSHPNSPCLGFETAKDYVRIGENDQALEELNRSLTLHCRLLAMLRTEPVLDPLRGDPRYKDMLKRVNLGD
jgi:TolB-like protein/DNA-binding winged helix-turn-helix (wHTH) protein